MTLSTAKHLHHQHYKVEVLEGEDWIENDNLHVLPDGVFYNDDHIETAYFHKEDNSIKFNSHNGDCGHVGRFDFTHRGEALVGTLKGADGRVRAIRAAKGYDEKFDTLRAPKNKPSDVKPWEVFEIKTYWDDSFHPPLLKVDYKLGADDVSDRVRVTNVNQKTGETTLEMVASASPFGGTDTFSIVLAFGGKSFSGTYTAEDLTVYNWTGQLHKKSLEKLTVELNKVASKTLPETKIARTQNVVKPMLFAQAAYASAVTKSVQELDNISSVITTTDKDGKTVVIDQAQTRAGSYFNKCLVNGLDEPWLTDIFGHPYSLNSGTAKVASDNSAFFKANSVLATGTMLETSFAADKTHGGAIQKISDKKIQAKWKDISTSKTNSPQYQKATTALYNQAYGDAVAGMQAYIDDTSGNWGQQYYDYLTDENTLLTWQIQLASNQFKNVKTRMYEWHTKLTILSPNTDHAKKMLSIAYSALLGVMYTKVKWSDDIKPYLEAVLEQAINGSIDFSDQMTKQAAEETRKILSQMASISGMTAKVINSLMRVLNSYQRKNPNQTWRNFFRGNDVIEAVETDLLINDAAAAPAFKAWADLAGKTKAGAAFGGIVYMGAAAFFIFSIASNSGQKLTPREIVVEVNMGIIALASTLKGVQKILTLGLGSKIISWAGDDATGFANFMKNIATWFSESGEIVATTKFGSVMTSILGKNITEFFSNRLGPVLAVFGIVISAWFLADAIIAGDVPNIIFDSLNLAVALAGTIALGFEMASFAMAGPVGLVIAAIGLIIALVQLLYSLFGPPATPPKDPIQKFVEGPMTTEGLVK